MEPLPLRATGGHAQPVCATTRALRLPVATARHSRTVERTTLPGLGPQQNERTVQRMTSRAAARGSTLIEVGIATLLMLSVAAGVTVSATQAVSRDARVRLELAAGATLESVAVAVQAGGYDQAMLGTDNPALPGCATGAGTCVDVGAHAQRPLLVAVAPASSGPAAARANAAVVTLTVVLPGGGTVAQTVTVYAEDQGYALAPDEAVVHVTISGPTPSSVALVSFSASGTGATPKARTDIAGATLGTDGITRGGTAILRVSASSCTTAAPCRVVLNPDGPTTLTDTTRSVGLARQSAAAQVRAAGGVVTSMTVRTYATGTATVFLEATTRGNQRVLSPPVTGSVCLHVTIDTAVLPGCNTVDPARITFDHYPMPENPSYQLPLPAGVDLPVTVDRPDGTCGVYANTRVAGTTAGGPATSTSNWRSDLYDCTSWTWGTPAMWFRPTTTGPTVPLPDASPTTTFAFGAGPTSPTAAATDFANATLRPAAAAGEAVYVARWAHTAVDMSTSVLVHQGAPATGATWPDEAPWSAPRANTSRAAGCQTSTRCAEQLRTVLAEATCGSVARCQSPRNVPPALRQPRDAGTGFAQLLIRNEVTFGIDRNGFAITPFDVNGDALTVRLLDGPFHGVLTQGLAQRSAANGTPVTLTGSTGDMGYDAAASMTFDVIVLGISDGVNPEEIVTIGLHRGAGSATAWSVEGYGGATNGAQGGAAIATVRSVTGATLGTTGAAATTVLRTAVVTITGGVHTVRSTADLGGIVQADQRVTLLPESASNLTTGAMVLRGRVPAAIFETGINLTGNGGDGNTSTYNALETARIERYHAGLRQLLLPLWVAPRARIYNAPATLSVAQGQTVSFTVPATLDPISIASPAGTNGLLVTAVPTPGIRITPAACLTATVTAPGRCVLQVTADVDASVGVVQLTLRAAAQPAAGPRATAVTIPVTITPGLQRLAADQLSIPAGSTAAAGIQLSVRGFDGRGAPRSGTVVTGSSSSSSVQLQTDTVTLDGAGVAKFTLLSDDTGDGSSAKLTFTAPSPDGGTVTTSVVVPVTSARPAAIAVTTATGVNAVTATTVPIQRGATASFTVTVTDAAGRPVRNAFVVASVTRGGGLIAPRRVLTDAAGSAALDVTSVARDGAIKLQLTPASGGPPTVAVCVTTGSPTVASVAAVCA